MIQTKTPLHTFDDDIKGIIIKDPYAEGFIEHDGRTYRIERSAEIEILFNKRTNDDWGADSTRKMFLSLDDCDTVEKIKEYVDEQLTKFYRNVGEYVRWWTIVEAKVFVSCFYDGQYHMRRVVTKALDGISMDSYQAG